MTVNQYLFWEQSNARDGAYLSGPRPSPLELLSTQVSYQTMARGEVERGSGPRSDSSPIFLGSPHADIPSHRDLYAVRSIWNHLGGTKKHSPSR